MGHTRVSHVSIEFGKSILNNHLDSVSFRLRQHSGLGLNNKRNFNVVMCMKPMYGTDSVVKMPVFIEYHLAMGVQHFVIYKNPKGLEPLTAEGMIVLYPYIKRGLVTIVDLYDSMIDTNNPRSHARYYQKYINTHCMWFTRGKTRWSFVQVDIDEFWTPIPFTRNALTTALDSAYNNSVFSLMTDHRIAEPTNMPLFVSKVQGERDKTWGKSIVRPDLVHVAWVHAPVNFESGYKEQNMREYTSDAYFLHFQKKHWDTYTGPVQNFSYPKPFVDQIISSLETSFMEL